jgi:UDP-GlcNAc:undecaprenyl-phosphate GlcNAc-1-phosphate transferase
MNISQLDYFLLFGSSFFVSTLITPLIRRVALAYGVLDKPNSSHKSHSKPVPYLGGLAIMISVLLVAYTSVFRTEFIPNNLWLASSILVPASMLGIVGLIDDIKNLKPLPKFIVQSLAGLVIAIILVLNNNLGNPTGLVFLDITITVIWIVGICNSINFFDNLDGATAGTVAITSFFLAYLAYSGAQYLVAALSLVISGSVLGFLIWNRNPARIYMGDAGALFLGVVVATLTIRFKPSTDQSIGSFSIPILLLAIPILDTTVAVFSRLKRGISPFKGGKDHLSHRLIRLGISKKNTAYILWLCSIFFGFISIILTNSQTIGETYILAFASITWSLLLLFFIKTKHE